MRGRLGSPSLLFNIIHNEQHSGPPGRIVRQNGAEIEARGSFKWLSGIRRWRRAAHGSPAEQALPCIASELEVRGRATGPRGEPAGVLPRSGTSTGRGSPVGGEAYPAPSPADARYGPSAGSAVDPGPLVVELDGERIRTVTAAHFHLVQKHGGRCSVKMVPGRWLVRRRSLVLAAYAVEASAEVGVDLVVSRVVESGVREEPAASGVVDRAQRGTAVGGPSLIHRALSLVESGWKDKPYDESRSPIIVGFLNLLSGLHNDQL